MPNTGNKKWQHTKKNPPKKEQRVNRKRKHKFQFFLSPQLFAANLINVFKIM